MTKAALRAELGAVRRARSAEAIAAARTAVRRAVLARQATQGWRCVACYQPLRTEPGSIELLDELSSAGVQVLVPVLLADRDLDWAGWDHPSGQAGASPGRAGASRGPAAITAADAVLVPALAVAPDGTRLGRGGGSYDRALRRVRTRVPVAALLYDGEVLATVPRDDWDVPVNAVVTPSGWRDLTGADTTPAAGERLRNGRGTGSV